MADLLFELFSEEIPARMQAGAARDMLKALEGKLSAVLRNPADAEIVDIPQVYWDDLGGSR